MISCQFFQSRLCDRASRSGEPSVSPARTPERNSTRVLLDLHAASAPVALLPPRELGVHVGGEQRQAGRHSFENADERLAV